MKASIFLTMTMAFFGGCAAPINIVLVRGANGDIRECKRDPLKNWSWEEDVVIKKCIDEYKKSGYVPIQ